MTNDQVTVYIMGKAYKVPSSLTIMKAMEYAGYQLIRGCGCRGGFCGACGTVYRKPGSYKVNIGLACQTVVEDGMYLAQIPFFPAVKKTYNIEEMKPVGEAVVALYPELARCVSCNTCTKSCPQSIEVMDAVNTILRGDLAKAADMTFDCIMCGMCTARCPAEIAHYNVFILVQRLFGSKIAPRSSQLQQRIKEIEENQFAEGLAELISLPKEELKSRYKARDIEPEED